MSEHAELVADIPVRFVTNMGGKLVEVVQAVKVDELRDERDRLRKALEDIRDRIGNGALNVNRIKQYAEAALTPAAKGGDDD